MTTMQLISPQLDHGGNSLLLFIPERYITPGEASQIVAQLSGEFRTYVVSAELPQHANVAEFAETLVKALSASKIKWVTVCGIGPGATVAQALTAYQPRLVRRLVLINATTRIAPDLSVRFLDWLERVLPLGLPLRPLSRDFDARPFLHRLRCPTLVITDVTADAFVQHQAQYIAEKIPNAWAKRIKNVYQGSVSRLSDELNAILTDFLLVPAKRPQKNAGAASVAPTAPESNIEALVAENSSTTEHILRVKTAI